MQIGVVEMFRALMSVMFVLGSALPTTGMAAETPAPAPAAEAPAPRLDIVVDPRIELVAVVSALAGDRPGWSPRETSPYREAMLAWGRRHRDHPAVERMRAIDGFGYSYPAEAILHYGPPPEFVPLAPATPTMLEGIGGQPALDAWVQSLREFARDTRYMAFFRSQQPEFDSMIARTRAAFGDRDIVAPFEGFYGLDKPAFTLVLAPNILPGAFGPSVAMPDGSMRFYTVQGSAGMDAGTLSFGNIAAIASLSWHEFGHSVVNPLNAAKPDALAKSRGVFDRSAEALGAMAYPDWGIAANELIVRANTLALCRMVFKGNDLLTCIDSQRTPSAQFNEDVYRLAETRAAYYLQNRTKWPRYADFHPLDLQILEYFAGDR